MVLNPKIQVHVFCKYSGIRCRGLQATAPIAKGEWIWRWENEPLYTFTREQMLTHPDPHERAAIINYSYMLEDDLYGSETDPEHGDTSYFVNHTCDPNCWYTSDSEIVALRDIEAGEEVAYDYAFTETEASPHAGLKCMCGSANVRRARPRMHAKQSAAPR